MNRKAMIENCVQYILDQDHERENSVDELIEDAKDYKSQGYTKPTTKAILYEKRVNFIYWQAKCLAHGTRHANNAFRTCIAEAIERVGL